MELVLISIAVLVSAIAAIIAAVQVYKRRKAEEELVRLLRAELRKDSSLVKRMSSNPHQPSSRDVQRAGQTIEKAAASMKEPDRELVLRGLKQRSDTGRIDYIRKLVVESEAGQGGANMGCD